MKKLTKRDSRFIDEYLIDLDVERAAIEAGYSPTTAASKAYQWVSNGKVKPLVFNEIKRRMLEREKRTGITQDRILSEIAKMPFFNIQDIYDEYGELIPVHELPRDVAAAIQEINQDSIAGNEEQVIKRKYKLSDKKTNLELLCRHLGLFTEKIINVNAGELSKEQRDAMSNELLQRESGGLNKEIFDLVMNNGEEMKQLNDNPGNSVQQDIYKRLFGSH